MTGPIHMNQVIYQAPTVEKIHQVEHQQPDQAMRQTTVDEQAKVIERTETVQIAEESKSGHQVDAKKQEERERKRRRAAKPGGDGLEDDSSSEPETESRPAKGSGHIVDVVV
jgi:hypothetical protein